MIAYQWPARPRLEREAPGTTRSEASFSRGKERGRCPDDHDEHLGQLSLILDPPPVDQCLVLLVVCPENTPQVTVSDGQSHHGDHVGYQEEHDLRKYKNQIRSSCRALDINLVVVVE